MISDLDGADPSPTRGGPVRAVSIALAVAAVFAYAVLIVPASGPLDGSVAPSAAAVPVTAAKTARPPTTTMMFAPSCDGVEVRVTIPTRTIAVPGVPVPAPASTPTDVPVPIPAPWGTHGWVQVSADGHLWVSCVQSPTIGFERFAP